MNRRLALAALAALALALAGCGFSPGAGSGGDSSPDAGASGGGGDGDRPDAGGGEPAGCSAGGAGCTCVPDPGPGGCVHSYGGRFGDGACSPSYQCCDGQWRQGHGSCGECTCVDDGTWPGCGTAAEICFPAFEATVEPIPQAVRDEMTGVSWHAGLGCPSFDELRLVTLDHWGFDGEVKTGELVVAASAASAIVSAFEQLYIEQFPIERMVRVDAYGGDDDASMAANNTSAFNCRKVTGGSSLSEHSFGTAIDINPVQNPYVNGGTVLPPSGSAYVDRGRPAQGMIHRPGPVTRAFDAIGWGWGGDWNGLKDYQHVSESGR